MQCQLEASHDGVAMKRVGRTKAQMASPLFKQDDFVRRRNNPDITGKVANAIWDDQVKEWVYQIRFGGGMRAVPESGLELAPLGRLLVEVGGTDRGAALQYPGGVRILPAADP